MILGASESNEHYSPLLSCMGVTVGLLSESKDESRDAVRHFRNSVLPTPEKPSSFTLTEVRYAFVGTS